MKMPRNTVLLGDALERLRELPSSSMDAVVTSPPYVGLRRYGSGEGEIGTEGSVEAFVDKLSKITAELHRALKPTGSLWLNIGDSFSRGPRWGATTKGMLLAPERLLLRLSQQGWLVRGKVIWHKPNGMPNSVRDRFSCRYEYLYHLVREPQYFFDLDAVRIPHQTKRRGLTARSRCAKAYVGRTPRPSKEATRSTWAGPLANGHNDGLERARAEGRAGHRWGKNPGDVWTIPTAGFRGPHPAVFPERLVERPLLATCPATTCAHCGTPWHQVRGSAIRPECDCGAGSLPGLVLDPFMGAGTVGVVARKQARDWLGIELNPSFRELALSRIASTAESVQQRRQPEEVMPLSTP